MPPARSVEGEDAITQHWSKALRAQSQPKVVELGRQDRLYVLRFDGEGRWIANDFQLEGISILLMQFPDTVDNPPFPLSPLKVQKGLDAKEPARAMRCRPAGPCLGLPAVSVAVNKKTTCNKKDASEGKAESRSKDQHGVRVVSGGGSNKGV